MESSKNRPSEQQTAQSNSAAASARQKKSLDALSSQLDEMTPEEHTEAAAESLEKTMYVPLPAPSFDEESGAAIGEQCYVQDVSRLGHVEYDASAPQEIPLPHYGEEDGAGHYVPGEGKSRSKLRPVLALLLVAAMAAGIVAAGSYGLEVWGGKPVPDVRGTSEERAIATLTEAGFTVDTQARVADDGIGTVVAQEPFCGVRIQKGSPVTIVVAESRTIPQVIGLSSAEATDILTNAGAQDIDVTYEDSDAPEDTVLAISPNEGSGFTGHQTVKLTVAQKIQVPNVTGEDIVKATSGIETAGLNVKVEYIYEDGKENTVVRTEPEAGAKVDPKAEIKLFAIEPMPSDPLHLLEFFGKSSASIASYMPQRGFELEGSFITDESRANALYKSPALGEMFFGDRPFSHEHLRSENTGEDVLESGLPFTGIRWELPSSLVPASASRLSEDAINSIKKRCAFSGESDRCTQKDIKVPDTVTKSDAKFLCVCGASGDKVWTVLIVTEKNAAPRAVVTCAPSDYYASNFDLKPFGDSVCDFVACADVYNQL